jgi:hypothetical protein
MAGIASIGAKALWRGDFKRGENQELPHLSARCSRRGVCGFQFETSFENKKSAVETVIPMMDGDGRWRVSSYFIK